MKLKMSIDDALAFADEWSRGMTVHEDSQGWRVVCMLLAEEVRRQRAVAPFSSTEHSASSSNDGSAPALSAAPSPTPPGFVDPAKSDGRGTGAADGGQDSFGAWRQS